MIYDKWEKRDKCRSISEVSARNFGFSDLSTVDIWEQKFKDNNFHIHNLDKAVSVVKNCIRDGYKFAILGDYDADGITGTTILTRGLVSLGISIKDIQIIIPDRITEGYGAKPMHVERIKGDNICLIFVDNGITAEDTVKCARERGFRTVVLDHHLAVSDKILSLADAVVDPEAEDILYKKTLSDSVSYCGAGLAFSFMRHMSVDNNTLRKLLCFAAIGTVCDVMPLTEENFCFVKYGMPLITDERYAPSGLFALTTALNLNGARLCSKDIGFSYGPVINAASRMKGKTGAYDVIKLFLYDGSPDRKVKAAERLLEVNNERKRTQNTGCLIAERIISEEKRQNDRPLVLYIPGINEGIVGIIAGKLSEKYRTPAYVLTDSNEEGIIKGSGRSFGNYDMSDALNIIRPLLVSGGGHPGACGISIKLPDLDKIREILMDNFPDDYTIFSEDTLYFDLEIDAKNIDKAMPYILARGPYGEGHKEIVFKIDNFQIIPSPKYVNVLSDQKSVKISGLKATAFAFGMAESVPENMKCADIIGTLSENYFLGKKTIRVEVLDIKDTTKETEYKETELAAKLRQMN